MYANIVTDSPLLQRVSYALHCTSKVLRRPIWYAALGALMELHSSHVTLIASAHAPKGIHESPARKDLIVAS